MNSTINQSLSIPEEPEVVDTEIENENVGNVIFLSDPTDEKEEPEHELPEPEEEDINEEEIIEEEGVEQVEETQDNTVKTKVKKGLNSAKKVVLTGVNIVKETAKVEFAKFKQTEVGSKIVDVTEQTTDAISVQYNKFKKTEIGQHLGEAAEKTKQVAKAATKSTLSILKKSGGALSSWVKRAKDRVENRMKSNNKEAEKFGNVDEEKQETEVEDKAKIVFPPVPSTEE